jgi:hypothetical protein
MALRTSPAACPMYSVLCPLTEPSPPQQGYGQQPYGGGGGYGQPTPPPQQYGYNHVSVSPRVRQMCVKCPSS